MPSSSPRPVRWCSRSTVVGGPHRASGSSTSTSATPGSGSRLTRWSRLFQSFSQADASISRRYGGTGLGLAISRRIAELMEGSLSAESAGIPGAGSTFHLVVGLRETTDLAGLVPRSIVPIELAGRRVLVVDDNATNRRILTAQLRRWSMESQDTEFPLEALRWIEAGQTFDIGILDQRMPDMDGIELAEAIKAAQVETALPAHPQLVGRGARSGERCHRRVHHQADQAIGSA